MSFTNEEISMLKGKGYLLNKDGEHFSFRVVAPGGKLNVQEAQKVTEVCEKYGQGYFMFTERKNIEIPGIDYSNLEEASQVLAEVGLMTGSTGSRPRPVTACNGSVCKFALFDTDAYTAKLNERFYKGFYDAALPSKLRIVVSGCFNKCSMPQIGCIGVYGKKLNQVALTLGGMSARKQYLGQEIQGTYTLDEASDLIEKAILYYQENGQKGERMAQMIDRIGFETVEKALIG
jgi:dissimilatory sulfite reductase (desulfoviridin) alpha/beta subunit